jgi:hypothetical protein
MVFLVPSLSPSLLFFALLLIELNLLLTLATNGKKDLLTALKAYKIAFTQSQPNWRPSNRRFPVLSTLAQLTYNTHMENNQPFLTDDEFQSMTGIDIESLVSTRLEDLADQIAFHAFNNDWASVELLKAEGSELAEAYDDGYNFFFVNDLTLN